MDPASIHTDYLSQPVLGDLQRAEKLLIKNLTGVNGGSFLRLRATDLLMSLTPSCSQVLALSMVIHDLDMIGIPWLPEKADPLLVVDTDAVLTFSVS